MVRHVYVPKLSIGFNNALELKLSTITLCDLIMCTVYAPPMCRLQGESLHLLPEAEEPRHYQGLQRVRQEDSLKAHSGRKRLEDRHRPHWQLAARQQRGPSISVSHGNLPLFGMGTYSWTSVIRPPVIQISLLSGRDLGIVYCLFFIHFHIKSCSKPKQLD